jgi:hypothetical protein
MPRALLNLEIDLYRETVALSNICDAKKRFVQLGQVAENLQRISTELRDHATQYSQNITPPIDNP